VGRAAGGLLSLIAGLIRLVVAVVVAIIVIGIVLAVFEANPANDIVQAVDDAASFLARPFEGLFDLDSAKWQKALNWGIAALVYAIVGGFVASLIGRAGGAARRPLRRRRRDR
jgi:hypothetical protein